MKKKKVLVFSPHALENGRGGEFFCLDLALGLQKFYNTTFLDTNRFIGKPLLSKKDISKKIRALKIKDRINFATCSLSNLYFNFPYPWEIVKLYKIVKKHDVIYIALSNFKTELMFMLFSLIHRQGKFIIGYHKPLHTEKRLSLYNLKYRLTILFFSLFKKNIYHHTISLHAKRFLENFYEKDKVIYIIEGLNLDSFLKSYEIKTKKKNSLNFIYVGAFDDAHKGVGVLLRGIELFLKENKNIKVSFEFCGAGPLDIKLKELEKKFPEHIKYWGYVSIEVLFKCYKRNDVLLFSSRREPFGRVIIEALSTGKVILCSKTIGSIEILKNKEFAFFLQKLTPDEIKKKIFEIYNQWVKNPEKFEKLKKLAKEHIVQNYSLSKEIAIFRNFIDNIYS